MASESINPLTKDSYIIPDLNSENNRIRNFVENGENKIVAVQGLGFVGAVMSMVVANSSLYKVLGVDLPGAGHYWKIGALNSGKFPIESSDQKVEEYYQKALKSEKFLATYSTDAYQYADYIIVDINLDVQKQSDSNKNLIDFDVDLSGFKNAMRSIAQNCKEDALILVESTVPPGTCQKVVLPIFEEEFAARKIDRKPLIGHSYERVMPGPGYVDSITNFYRVYSGVDNASADATESFLNTIISTEEYPLTRLANTNASEIGKVLENSYRAMNIAFIEEWGKFAEKASVNLFEVINAIKLRPTHANLMRPGLGVGGYCLTKDPLLASWSSKNLFDSERLEVSEKAVKINDRMPVHAFDVIKSSTSLKDKKVLMLGVSYLNDVGDTRYSPSELLYTKLIEEGAVLSLQDFYVPYWEELGLEVETDIEKSLKQHYDILVFCVAHKAYKHSNTIIKYINQNQPFVYDVNSVFDEQMINQINTEKLTILGRGDI